MSNRALPKMSMDTWLASEAIPFSLQSPDSVNDSVDRVIRRLPPSVEFLGFGEPLHGGEEFLQFRNRLFERLVLAHGYRAIAIESTYPHAGQVNEFITGSGSGNFEAVMDGGFGHGFGHLEANRELVAWMRKYNSESDRPVPLHFYGFDIPACATGIASPGPILRDTVDYLVRLDGDLARERQQRIETLLGADADWENPAIYTDPTQSPGESAAARALRIEVEELISEYRIRQPELIARSDAADYREALHRAVMTRQLLNYHAALARNAGLASLLGIRDALMADNLAHIRSKEHGRGKILVFAHNAHLQRGIIKVWPAWQKALKSPPFAWWSAGAHLARTMGDAYAVIGSALGESEANGIGPPEPGTLEARLTALPGSARWIPTCPLAEEHPVRSTGEKNLSYVPLTSQTWTDFDWLVILNAASYHRGGRPL